MKIEQVIVLHLYRNRQVTLQGLGTLYLDNSDSLPVNADMKGPALPVSVRFAYNPNAGEDPSLVDAIVEQTRKLKGLASADLESFINWQKQLLNINMPFTIGDLGELNKASEGSLIFTPFRKQLSLHKATGKSGIKSEHGTMQVGNTSRSKYLWLIAVLVGLSIFLWAVYTTVITPKSTVKMREQKTLGATSAKGTCKSSSNFIRPHTSC